MVNHASANKGTLTRMDVKVGVGKKAIAGKIVSVHYTGWLLDDSAPEECSELPVFVSMKLVLSCLDNKGNKFDKYHMYSGVGKGYKIYNEENRLKSEIEKILNNKFIIKKTYIS